MNITIGDKITFKVDTRDGSPKLTRVVNGFFGQEKWPTVRAHGCNNFVVKHSEIIKISKALS